MFRHVPCDTIWGPMERISINYIIPISPKLIIRKFQDKCVRVFSSVMEVIDTLASRI